MSFYGALRKVYAGILPKKVRHSIYMATPAPLKRMRGGLIKRLEKGAAHDEIYNAEYYERDVDPLMQASSGIMAQSIIDAFKPARIVDVGCGTGALLMALRERGVEGVGLEYSQAAVDLCRKRGLTVHQLDLEKDTPPKLTADVVISTEVAEHLPERCAETFIDVLCGFGGSVVMTAATPGQGGADHVNEQPHAYWIEKMARRGLTLDEPTTLSWRQSWASQGVEGCYAMNIMVFRRGTTSP